MRLSPRFTEALAYAAMIHRDQLRKGSPVPYLGHLLGVASITIDYGGSEDEAIGALLHDAIEDQGVTRDELAGLFGPEVADIVAGCSDTDVTPKPPWRARKEAYLHHLPQVSPSVRFVSCADKLHNVRALIEDYRGFGEELWPRFRGGREGTLWYYRALADTLLALEDNPLTRELARRVAELEALAGS